MKYVGYKQDFCFNSFTSNEYEQIQNSKFKTFYAVIKTHEIGAAGVCGVGGGATLEVGAISLTVSLNISERFPLATQNQLLFKNYNLLLNVGIQ